MADLAAFGTTDPDTGTLPALVWGDVPDRVPDGTLLAVAVNGRIGAVVPVVPADPGGRRFADEVAVMVVTTDSPVPRAVVDEIAGSQGFLAGRAVSL